VLETARTKGISYSQSQHGDSGRVAGVVARFADESAGVTNVIAHSAVKNRRCLFCDYASHLLSW